MPAATTFYFDVGSPYAYLASERIDTVLGGAVRWQPVLLGGLFKLTGRSSWALGDYRRRQRGMAEIERRAQSYGLPPIMWPDPWPTDYLKAMRVATYAYGIGRGREFVTCAFRDAFQRGRELSITAHVLAAAERAGIDRGAAQHAIGDPEVKQTLREATDAAHALGVFGVPTVAIGGGGGLGLSAAPDGGALGLSAAPDGGALEFFWGDDRLQDAAAHLRAAGSAA